MEQLKRIGKNPFLAPVVQLLALALVVVLSTVLTVRFFPEMANNSVLPVLQGATLAIVFWMIGTGIDLQEARKNLRLVILVVTLGVLAKFGLTMGLLSWDGVSLSPEMVMSVVQVDALSVVFIALNPWMSGAAKTAMGLCAMLDDPVTAFLAEIFRGAGSEAAVQAVLPYLAVLALFGLYLALRWKRQDWIVPKVNRMKRLINTEPEDGAPDNAAPDWVLTCLVVVVLAFVVATQWFTFAALLGLLVRPRWLGTGLTTEGRRTLEENNDADVKTRADLLTWIVLFLAFVQLGPFLIEGPQFAKGAPLGTFVFLAHVIVMPVLLVIYRALDKGMKLTWKDILFMTLAHQNGLTAVTLSNWLSSEGSHAPSQVIGASVPVTFGWYLVTNLILFGVLAWRKEPKKS